MRVVAWTAGVAWFLICTSLSYGRFARHAPAPVVLQHGAVQPPPAKLEPTAAPVAGPAEKAEPENPTWDHSLDFAPQQLDAPAPSAASPSPPAPALPPAPILPPTPRRTLAVPPSAPGSATGPALSPPIARPVSALGHPSKSHKDRAPKAAQATSAAEQAGGTTEVPAARCLECGAPATSWVEVDGKRVGYCRKHYSRLDRPRSSRKGSRKQPAAPAVSPDAAGSAVPPEEPAPATGQQEPRAAAAASVQCRGFTKDGTRCRRKTKDPSGFCYQHRPR